MSSGEKLVLKKRRKHYRIPMGFTVDASDPTLVVPDPALYQHILKARDMRKNGATLKECGEIGRAHV